MSAISALRLLVWLLIAAFVGGLSVLAYFLFGWIGVGGIGLFGLVISTNISLTKGHAVTGSGLGSGDVTMYARQLDAQESQSSAEQKMAASAEQVRQTRLRYLINSVFIAMTVLGFGLFVLHQL